MNGLVLSPKDDEGVWRQSQFCEIPEVVVAYEVSDDALVVLVGIGMLRI